MMSRERVVGDEARGRMSHGHLVGWEGSEFAESHRTAVRSQDGDANDSEEDEVRRRWFASIDFD